MRRASNAPPAAVPDFVRMVLYGVLPAIAAALLLVGAFGTRWLGTAVGVGTFAALGLLRDEVPAWPPTLWDGTNDGLSWFAWCLLAVGAASAAAGPRLPPRWAAVPGGIAALAGQVWLELTKRRAYMGDAEVVIVHAVAIATAALVWLGTRRALAQRGAALQAWLLTACLCVDSYLLLAGGSALQGQLAGAAAAAFGAAAGTALWRRAFRLDVGAAWPFAGAHCGLLLAGVQIGELGLLPALLAAFAPVPLSFAGPGDEGSAGTRVAATTIMTGAMLAIAAGLMIARS